MKEIHALEFTCLSALQFYERCMNCPKMQHGTCKLVTKLIRLFTNKATLTYERKEDD